MLALLAALLVHPAVAVAQETIEQRYQRAMQLYNSGRADKMEDACQLFDQIENQRSDYRDTRTYHKVACDAVKGAYATEEKLFNEGMQLFNQKQLEDAKQKFEQASRFVLKNPKHRDQIESYLKQIESMVREEATYREAARLFNQGKYGEARDRFVQIERSGGVRVVEARDYLRRLEEHEDSAFNEGVRSYSSGDFSNARRLFNEIIGMNGKRKAEAQSYLSRLDAAEAVERAFGEAERAFNEKRSVEAKTRFDQYILKGGFRVAEARKYLQRIDAAQKQEEDARALAATKVKEGQNPRQAALQLVALAQTATANRQYADARANLKAAEILDPANRDVRSLLSQVEKLEGEDLLRKGLVAYFQGKYDDAERYLSEYVDSHGHKRALAYFFRGAVHSSRYFLSGEQNVQQKKLAQNDFRALRKEAPQFQLPEKFVSPKILALYSQAAGAH